MNRSAHRIFGALLALICAAAIGLAPDTASAQAESYTVYVITASADGTDVDAGIASDVAQRLTAQHRQFTNFELNGTESVSLSQGDSQSFSVPGGSAALSMESDGLYITMPDGFRTRVGGGSIHFQLGPPNPSGTLILAIVAG